MNIRLLAIVFMLVICAAATFAQTTEFTYQGKLNDGAGPANGSYDLEFRLFDAVSGGAQIGSVAARNGVAVANGIFSVTLNFASGFTGADRFLEISVRNAGAAGFTQLNPRQKVNSSPYAIKSLAAENAVSATSATNALQLGSVAADQFVQTGDARLTDPRPPIAGSANYIHNGTTLQATSNFNVSQTGEAENFNARSEYRIGGSRVLSTSGLNNLFAGVGAGSSNNGGIFNSFFGFTAGGSNVGGSENSFFGARAGLLGQDATKNSFFGATAGQNSTGSRNSFFGSSAGFGNTSGFDNAFFGLGAGSDNLGGSNNTMIGRGANVGSGNLTFATAIGAGSIVSASNTIALGRAADSVLVPGNLTVTGTFTGNLPTGSANYIQNTTSPQAASNFNISANGTVGGTLSAATVNVTNQYNIGGTRILSSPGTSNLFVGILAGNSNTGVQNTFLGRTAGVANSSGDRNSFVGASAGSSNTFGSSNSFFGSTAGLSNTIGDNNSFFGDSAGALSTEGSENSFFGSSSGFKTTGGLNAFFGYLSGQNNQSGLGNVFVGARAGQGNSSGSTNTFVGVGAGDSNSTSHNNTFVGGNTGLNNMAGASNTFLGASSGNGNTNGSNNTVVGANANVSADNLTFATAIGSGAQVSTNNTVVLGRSADLVTIPGSQLSLGGSLFLNRVGTQNTFVGANAGTINTGEDNTFVGTAAGNINGAGGDNTFVGVDAGGNNLSGNSNTFVGRDAGDTATGSNNTIIGASADVSSPALTNATALGQGTVVNASNKVRLGNTSVTVVEGQVAYTFSSDKHLKENFLAVDGRDVLRKIRGFNMTSWNYIGQDSRAFRHYGPMAQDFYAAFGKDKFGSFGTPTTINTGDMSGVMLAAIKELSTENETQRSEIAEQRAANSEQQKMIAEQQRQVEVLVRSNAELNARLRAVEKRFTKKLITRP